MRPHQAKMAAAGRARGGLPYDAHLDNLLACWSVRKLIASATNAMRVRRSSDNAETDVGFTAAGDLDAATMLSWSGSDSVFVVRWYDQLGNSDHDLAQSTPGDQYRIVNAGVLETVNGNPGLYAPLDTSALRPAQTITPNTHSDQSLQMAFKSDTGSNHRSIISRTYDGALRGIVETRLAWNGASVTIDAGPGAAVLAGDMILMQEFSTPNAAGGGRFDNDRYRNGVIDHSYVNMLYGSTGVGSGGLGIAGSIKTCQGWMQELLVWDANLSANQAELASIANSYFGYY